jgi:hypothetical protein
MAYLQRELLVITLIIWQESEGAATSNQETTAFA